MHREIVDLSHDACVRELVSICSEASVSCWAGAEDPPPCQARGPTRAAACAGPRRLFTTAALKLHGRFLSAARHSLSHFDSVELLAPRSAARVCLTEPNSQILVRRAFSIEFLERLRLDQTRVPLLMPSVDPETGEPWNRHPAMKCAESVALQQGKFCELL